MIYDFWFFVRLCIGIIALIGIYYFIDWFIPKIGLSKSERAFSKAFKDVSKGRITPEEFVEIRDNYRRTQERNILNNRRREKLKKLRNL